MEVEGSLLYSQEPATYVYPTPDQQSMPRILFLDHSF
jgi:hypothetical protein